MGRLTVLLCMLLAGTYATRYQFSSRFNPNSFVSKTGTFYNFVFSNIPSMASTSQWTTSCWMYVTSTPYGGMTLIAIGTPYVGVYIGSGRFLMVNGEWSGFTNSESLPYGSWFHLILGSGNNEVFAVLTKRSGTQFSVVKAGSVTVTSTTVFTGPMDADTFTVISM